MAFSSDQPLVSNQLPISVDFPKEPELFLDIMTNTYKRIADAVNRKEGGVYSLQENATFKQYPTANDPQKTKNTYRKTFDMVSLNGGNIGPAVMVTVPHGITGIVCGTMITAGCANTEPRYFTVVYPDVYLTNTDVVFINPTGFPVTQCYVVAEYLKN